MAAKSDEDWLMADTAPAEPGLVTVLGAVLGTVATAVTRADVVLTCKLWTVDEVA